MLTTLQGTRDELPPELETELAAYRYDVFVGKLGWNLPCRAGYERDRFDGAGTVYVIAKDANGRISGCARLLPTTEPYLLAEDSPYLFDGAALPCSPDIWELSRFSTTPAQPGVTLSREVARQRFRTVFSAVVYSARKHGATRLVTFTALGIERILRVIGIHAHRIGPPVSRDGVPVVALWIELDDQTCDALNVQC